MEEQAQTVSTTGRFRRRVTTRSGVAIAIGTVVVASVATVGATTLSGHSISAEGSASMKIMGLETPGDVSRVHGSGWIDVVSWSFGASNSTNPAATGGAGAGKVTFNPFSITRKIDAASPMLYGACASGKVYPTLTFEADSIQNGEQGTPVENLQIVLSQASVRSCGSSGTNAGLDQPLESLSFNFSKIEWKYSDSSGKVVSRYSWDLKANKKV